jgi:hypothetical protein
MIKIKSIILKQFDNKTKKFEWHINTRFDNKTKKKLKFNIIEMIYMTAQVMCMAYFSWLDASSRIIIIELDYGVTRSTNDLCVMDRFFIFKVQMINPTDQNIFYMKI